MPGECYLGTINSLNKIHQDIIIDIFGKAQHRIFVDAYDISQKPVNETWPNFVNRIWTNMPDGMRFWKNDEGQDHILLGVLGEGSIYNQLKMCKTTGAIPIICIGHSEEKTSWLSPGNNNLLNHLVFLEDFCKYTAIWLREKMGFIQVHLEIWNEPQKFMIASTYAKVVTAMARGFMQYPNFKIHFGSNDINIDVNSYLPVLLTNKELIKLMKGQYYSSHELWGWQHGQGYIGKMVKLLEGTGIKLSITECSPTGDWGNYGIITKEHPVEDWGKLFNDLRDYHIEIYCILFIIRCEFFADVFDEIRVFTKEARMIDGKWYKSGDWLPNGYCLQKHLALRAFNQKYYYKQLPLERSVDGMIIKTIGPNETDSKSGYTVLLVNELLYKNGFLDAKKVGYEYTDYTKAAAIAFINFIKEGYPDDPVKQLLKADGRIGRQTIRYLIEEIHDESEREKYQFALEIMASPITIEGGGL